jgi:hypothetical protein
MLAFTTSARWAGVIRSISAAVMMRRSSLTHPDATPTTAPGTAILDELARQADVGRRVARQLTDGVVERGAQDHPKDLDAPSRLLALGRQPLEPSCNVLASQAVEADRADALGDVSSRRLVLLPGVVLYVHARLRPGA